MTDHLLSLTQRQELFACQALIAKSTVEALDVSVLPRTAWFDVRRSHIDSLEEGANTTADKLRTVVATDELRDAADREDIDQQLDDVVTSTSTANLQSQALASELVDQGKDLQRATVSGPIKDEIDRPNMIGTLRTSAPDAAARVAESSLFGLFGGHFQSLLSPDSVHPFEIHVPTFLTEKPSDHSVTVARKFADQFKDSMDQSLFVVSFSGLVTLGTA